MIQKKPNVRSLTEFNCLGNGFLIFFSMCQCDLEERGLSVGLQLGKMPLDLSPTEAELQLYSRLSVFASRYDISLSAFWKSSRLCLALEQFLNMLDLIDFRVTPEDLEALSSSKVEFINLAAVLEGVDYWRQAQQSVSAFVARQQASIEGPVSSPKKQSKQSGSREGDSKYEVRLRTGSSRAQRTTSKNLSRQLEAEIKLSHHLLQAKNESDYELTIRVGEANDLAKTLKNDSCFLIEASAEGEAHVVEVAGKSGEQKRLTAKAFQKKYEQLKTASLSKGEEVEGTLEEDLKKTLVQVMCLSDQLEQQIALLERKGVAH